MKQNFSEIEKVILDKNISCNNEVKYMLSRCLSMFQYDNLPATIPQYNLELILMTQGNCFLTKYNGNFYALSGTEGGEIDAYNNYKEYIVTNSALNISKNFKIGVDGVLIKNDFFSLGILPLLRKYCVMLTENHISIRQAIINARAISIISANDDKTAKSAEIFLKKMIDGELSVIGETPFFEGIKSYDISKSLSLHELLEIEQYLKASMFHELGINGNINLKRSVITSFETELNDEFLLPLVENFYNCRLNAIKEFNKMYDLNVKINFASSWLTNQLENLTEQKNLLQSELDNKNNEINSKDTKLTATTAANELLHNKIAELENIIDDLKNSAKKQKPTLKSY